jgi:RNA polymerase sigma-70 factor (ECF subfamily)
MTGNDTDAADATQEALIALVRGLGRFDGRAAFSTWAYRVATNACLDEMRRRGRRPTLASRDGELLETAPRGPSPHVDGAVSDRVSIDEALVALPLDFRVAVVLRDVLGLDYAEIASVLDIAPGTVRSRIARGRKALADQLGNPSEPENVRNVKP